MPFDCSVYSTPDDQRQYAIGILRRAKQLIEERGWCQGLARDREGRLCIAGAIHEAGFRGNLLTGLGIPWPGNWNDQAERTLNQVYTWFDEHITRLERQC